MTVIRIIIYNKVLLKFVAYYCSRYKTINSGVYSHPSADKWILLYLLCYGYIISFILQSNWPITLFNHRLQATVSYNFISPLKSWCSCIMRMFRFLIILLDFLLTQFNWLQFCGLDVSADLHILKSNKKKTN